MHGSCVAVVDAHTPFFKIARGMHACCTDGVVKLAVAHAAPRGACVFGIILGVYNLNTFDVFLCSACFELDHKEYVCPQTNPLRSPRGVPPSLIG